MIQGRLFHSIFSWNKIEDETLTPLEEISLKLAEEHSEHSHESDFYSTGVSSLLWLNYININDEFDLISIDEYRDFVELASPLEWMGEDELLDKSEQ